MKKLILLIAVLGISSIANAQSKNKVDNLENLNHVIVLGCLNTSAPFGGMLFLTRKNIGIFIDAKTNWQVSGGDNTEDYTEILGSTSTTSRITWRNGESYTRLDNTKSKSSAEVYHKQIFDIGMSTNFNKLTCYLGVGVYKLKTEHMIKNSSTTNEFTHYAYAGFNTYDIKSSEYCEIASVSYTSKLNITGGIIYNTFPFSIGCGFDTAPTSLNILFGCNF